MRRRNILTALALLLAVALIVTGCGDDKKKTAKEDRATLVAVAEAEMGRLSRGDLLTGKVTARTEINLVPKIGGRVTAVTVDMGDPVAAGQMLVQLETEDMAAAVSQAEAAVAGAESGLVQAELGFEQLKRTYERMQFLYDQGAIPEAELEEIENKYKSTREQVEKALPAQLQQARAGLQAAQANYNQCFMSSPINGMVSARYVDPGEMAGPGAPVLTIVDSGTVYVEVAASDRLVNRLEPGQEVQVLVRSAAEKPFTGKVVRIAPAADPRTRTYPVKVEVANPDGLLKPGMFAEVDCGAAEDQVVLVPRDAVFQREGADVAFVCVDGKLELRKVEPGSSDGMHIALLKGVAAGETVVVSGQDVLEDGQEVEAMGSEGAELEGDE